MRVFGILAAIGCATAVCAALAGGALAQTASGAPPSSKDCQTIRTCNFARGAEVRGCLSSFSCRSCRFEPRCRTVAGQRICDFQARCGWRGA